MSFIEFLAEADRNQAITAPPGSRFFKKAIPFDKLWPEVSKLLGTNCLWLDPEVPICKAVIQALRLESLRYLPEKMMADIGADVEEYDDENDPKIWISLGLQNSVVVLDAAKGSIRFSEIYKKKPKVFFMKKKYWDKYILSDPPALRNATKRLKIDLKNLGSTIGKGVSALGGALGALSRI